MGGGRIGGHFLVKTPPTKKMGVFKFPSFFFFVLSAFLFLSFSSPPLLFDILKPKICPPDEVFGLCIYIYISLSPSFSHRVSLSLSLYLSICPYPCLLVSPSLSVFVCLSLCLYASLRLFLYLSLIASFSFSLSLFISLPLCDWNLHVLRRLVSPVPILSAASQAPRY